MIGKHRLLANYYASDSVRFLCRNGDLVIANNCEPIGNVGRRIQVGQPFAVDE